MRPLIALAAALALALPAAAAHDGYELAPDLALSVEQLTVDPRPQGLVISYAFSKKDMKRLRRAGANPVLRVEADGQRARAKLDRRRGSLLLPCGGTTPSHVTVSVIDRQSREARTPIALSLSGILVEGLDLRVPRLPPPRVRPAPPPPPVDYTRYDAAAHEACKAAFYTGRSREACATAVQRASFQPASAVRACDRAFHSDSDTLQCVRAVGVAARDPSEEIKRCSRALNNARDTLQCVDSAARTPRNLSADITACDEAFASDAGTSACIAAAAKSRSQLAAVTATCDRAFHQDKATQRCVESAALSEVNAAQAIAAIKQCDSYYHRSRQTLQCVERALPGRVARR